MSHSHDNGCRTRGGITNALYVFRPVGQTSTLQVREDISEAKPDSRGYPKAATVADVLMAINGWQRLHEPWQQIVYNSCGPWYRGSRWHYLSMAMIP